MSMLTRTVSVVTLAALCGSATLSAQVQEDDFQWYIGPQAGYMMFETQLQTLGGIFMVGAHTLIKARRTGLMISLEQGFGSNELSSFEDASAPAVACNGLTPGVRCVRFDRLLRASAVLMAFPFKSHFQPFLGAGFGIQNAHSPRPVVSAAEGLTPAQVDNLRDAASSAGSYGFGTLLGGVQVRVGRKLVVYGQGQLISGPGRGKLFTGAGYTLEGGLRWSIGSSKESLTGTGIQSQ